MDTFFTPAERGGDASDYPLVRIKLTRGYGLSYSVEFQGSDNGENWEMFERHSFNPSSKHRRKHQAGGEGAGGAGPL